VYGTESEIGGPSNSVRMAEFRHRDVVRPDSPTNPQAWAELYDHVSGWDDGSSRSIVFDLADRYLDDYLNFILLDGFNNQASSVRWMAPIGCSIELHTLSCNDASFPGPVHLLEGTGEVESIEDLNIFVLDNAISAIRFSFDTLGPPCEPQQQVNPACLAFPGCPWDCGIQDGTVDIVDFLSLLAEWGSEGTLCDVDGGGVGITDFLKLLANWGECPVFPCVVFGIDGGGSDSANPADFGCDWPTVPGLNSFDFDYIGGDHHIDVIEIELSENLVSVAFDDNNNDDPYTWEVEAMPLPLGTTYGSVQGSDDGGCALSQPLVGDGVFVLTGFKVNYSKSDHHIGKFSIEFIEQGGNTFAKVCYHDKNLDDDFTYRVDYAAVPAASVIETGSTPSKTGNGVETISLGFDGVGVPLIRGFSFDFGTPGNDHHLKRVSVDISLYGDFTVAYHDHNLDDLYEWFVDYAIIGP